MAGAGVPSEKVRPGRRWKTMRRPPSLERATTRRGPGGPGRSASNAVSDLEQLGGDRGAARVALGGRIEGRGVAGEDPDGAVGGVPRRCPDEADQQGEENHKDQRPAQPRARAARRW